MAKPFQSHANWTEGTVPSLEDHTEDGHDTFEAAESVCKMLKRIGFGGEGKVFPIATWVVNGRSGVRV